MNLTQLSSLLRSCSGPAESLGQSGMPTALLLRPVRPEQPVLKIDEQQCSGKRCHHYHCSSIYFVSVMLCSTDAFFSSASLLLCITILTPDL